MSQFAQLVLEWVLYQLWSADQISEYFLPLQYYLKTSVTFEIYCYDESKSQLFFATISSFHRSSWNPSIIKSTNRVMKGSISDRKLFWRTAVKVGLHGTYAK